MTRGVGWRPGERGRALALATALAAAILTGASCAVPPVGDRLETEARAVRSKLAAGLDLYGAGDFAIAAERFAEAATGARRLRDPELERRARAAECVAWLRARQLDDFATCTALLEPLQRRARHSDAGVNTLVALGAIAGHRSPPVLRVPDSVAPLIRDVQQGAALEGGS